MTGELIPASKKGDYLTSRNLSPNDQQEHYARQEIGILFTVCHKFSLSPSSSVFLITSRDMGLKVNRSQHLLV